MDMKIRAAMAAGLLALCVGACTPHPLVPVDTEPRETNSTVPPPQPAEEAPVVTGYRCADSTEPGGSYCFEVWSNGTRRCTEGVCPFEDGT